jgi:hypothetical protein
MTRAAYEQLVALLNMSAHDGHKDIRVRRHVKGLLLALGRWLRMTDPARTQARTGTPRCGDDHRLAPTSATLRSFDGTDS